MQEIIENPLSGGEEKLKNLYVGMSTTKLPKPKGDICLFFKIKQKVLNELSSISRSNIRSGNRISISRSNIWSADGISILRSN